MNTEKIAHCTKSIYSEKDMEKCFIAGGKMARNIESPSFEETIRHLLDEKTKHNTHL